MAPRSGEHDLTRRSFLALSAGAAAAAPVIAVTDLSAPRPAAAQTPKRGGVFRIAAILDPVGFDPHQTISFTTMTMLSFAYSRLLKVTWEPYVKNWGPNNGFDYGGRMMAAWLDR
jgi:ABC-type transport system substrate-binding protein